MRASFSRMPRSVKPNGDATSRAIVAPHATNTANVT